MEYVRLNHQYALRHGRQCSYIVKRNGSYDDSILPGTNSFSIIPKYIGSIVSALGFHPYDKDIITISKKLGVKESTLRSFLERLIGNEKPLSLLDGTNEVIFPKRFLVKQDKRRNQNDRAIEYIKLLSKDMDSIFKPERPQYPLNINLMITNKCSTNCAYCYANRSIDEDLTTALMLDFINHAKRIGVVNLTLTGGDLLMRKDSLQIFEACIKSQFSLFISTKTPQSEEYVRRLKSIGVNEVQFSLDSANTSTLRRLLNVSDSYLDRVGSFFSACRNHKIKLSIRSVLTSQNTSLEEINNLYNFLLRYDNIAKWTLTPMFHSEYILNNDNLCPENDKLAEIFAFTRGLNPPFSIFYNKLGEKGYLHTQYSDIADYISKGSTCLANTTSVSILCDGTCTVCEMLYKNPLFVLGNIKERTLEEIWNSDKAISIFDGNISRNFNSPCNSCRHLFECKGDIFKHVCYVDVVKVHGMENGNQPDPKCPKCKKWNLIL